HRMLFRSWAAIPEHLGSHSGASGQPFRSIWAAIPEHLGNVACNARRAASSVRGVASVTAPSPDAAPPDETNSRSSAPQTRTRSQPPGDLCCNRAIQGVPHNAELSVWTVDDEVKLGINDLVELGEHLFQGAALRCPVFYLVDAKLDLDPPRGFYIAVRRSVETPKELEY